MSIGIYKITNKVNEKCYIGQSIDIERRWKKHKADNLDYPLYRAFRKYGIENFNFEIIEECSREDLNEREIYYISKYNSFANGYNATTGGDSFYSLEQFNRQLKIKNLLKNSEKTQIEIAIAFKIDDQTVSDINTGKLWRDENISYPIRKRTKDKNTCLDCSVEISWGATRCFECNSINSRTVARPSKETLIEKVALNGFESTGREYDVNGNTIKNWMKSYSLPYLINDVKRLYGNYIEPVKKKSFEEPLIEVHKEDSLLDINSVDGLVSYIREKNLSSANTQSIRKSILRVVNGKRDTYLGFKIKKI